MSVFERPWFDDHEEVVFASDPKAGFKAVIAVHDTSPFGMSGGGCRMWPYAHEQRAIDDVLRLSRAMTYKLTLANLPAGGAKMVVLADAQKDKNEALLRAIGRAVHRLNGRFIVGTDVGTNDADMEVVAKETPYVRRKHEEGHDSAKATAYGVFLALRWAVRRQLERDDLDGVRVAVQGVGRVGATLARYLHEAGAHLVVADVDADAARRVAMELGAKVVSADGILDVEADAFAPCALGDVIDVGVASSLRMRVVCGAANNPLTDEGLARVLRTRGVLFVPDFVANLGGVIGASPAGAGGGDATFLKPVERVVEVLDEAAAIADAEDLDLHTAAIALAKKKVQERKRK